MMFSDLITDVPARFYTPDGDMTISEEILTRESENCKDDPVARFRHLYGDSMSLLDGDSGSPGSLLGIAMFLRF